MGLFDVLCIYFYKRDIVRYRCAVNAPKLLNSDCSLPPWLMSLAFRWRMYSSVASGSRGVYAVLSQQTSESQETDVAALPRQLYRPRVLPPCQCHYMDASAVSDRSSCRLCQFCYLDISFVSNRRCRVVVLLLCCSIWCYCWCGHGVNFESVAACIVVVVVVWNRLLSGHCPFCCTICLGMLLLLRSRGTVCQHVCVNALVVVMQGRKELVVSQYQTSVLLLFNDKGMHSRTHVPCNYFSLPYMRLLRMSYV